MPAKPKKSKRFIYNLESVLKVRFIKEEQAKDALSKAEQELEEEIKKEKELKEFQRLKYIELRELMVSGTIITDASVAELQRRKAHLDILKDQVDEQIEKRKEAEKNRDEKRELLVTALKERKVLEKDKEKKRVAWKKFMDKEDAKFLDDISAIGYVKKSREQKS